MQLRSDAFKNGGNVPKRFTCDGANHSPSFAWSDAPIGTQSFAIICRDPDAPGTTWYHWALFDLPPDSLVLVEGRGALGLEAVNDFGKQGYGGPCPPHGHGEHHYIFRLYALNVRHLDVPHAARCRDIESASEAHAIATAELTGIYAR